MHTDQFINRYEKIILFFLLAFFSIYFYTNHFFVTIDSSAHLYNSSLLISLFSGQAEVNNYYEFNNELVPNWMGHLILSFLKLIFEGSVAEKLFLTIYLFSFVFSFRYLIRSFNKENGILALIALPFCFHVFLFFGFYNFSIAIVFYFLALAYWIRNHDNLSPKRLILFGILVIVLYFSHLFMFLLLLISLATHLLLSNGSINKNTLKIILLKSLKLLVAVLIPLVLFLFYFFKRSETATYTFLSAQEVFEQFKHLQSLVVYDIKERMFTDVLVYLLVLGVVIISITRIVKGEKVKAGFILFLFFISLLLLFIVPENDGKGGYIVLRMILLSWLFLVVWLACQNWNSLFKYLFISSAIILTLGMFRIKSETQKKFSILASQIYKSSEFIKTNDVILPIWKSAPWDWISAHYSNYLGINKSIIILENYEAIQDYFPLKWKPTSPLQPLISPSPSAYCDFIEKNGDSGLEKLDHILIYGLEINTINTCDSSLNEVLNTKCKLVYEVEFCRLYTLIK